MCRCVFALLAILFWGAAFAMEITVAEDSNGTRERKVSIFAEKYGKNFERNLFLMTKGFGKTRSLPSDVLQEATVQVELGLSDEQQDDLRDLQLETPLLPQVMAFAGLHDSKDVGRLSKKQATEAGVTIVQRFKEHQGHREKKVEAILTTKQYQRLKEIFHQKTLLFGVSGQVAENLGASHEDIVRLNRALREADQQIAAEAERLKWQAYLEHFDKVLGSGSSRRAFGKPYFVEAETNDESKQANRRRER